MPEIDQTRCAYCLKHLGPFFRHNYIMYSRFNLPKVAEDMPITPDLMLATAEQQVKVCLECAKDMGLKVDV